MNLESSPIQLESYVIESSLIPTFSHIAGVLVV